MSYESLAPFYDSLMPEEDYSLWADCCESLFRRRRIHTVLDLACGTGRLTWLLAERGYETIGVDLSCDMLAAAQAHPLKEGVTPPLFLNQAMEELDLYGTVQAAICSMDGVNYLAPELLPEVFRRVRLFLEPGGIFLFDLNTPFKFEMMDGEAYVAETDDIYCVWRADCEGKTCFYGMDIFLREGEHWRREQEEHIEYIHAPKELTTLLTQSGFSEPELFGGLPLRKAEEDEQRLFILCRAV